MKNLVILLFLAVILAAGGCMKDPTSERFDLLIDHIWTSDSLLADGVEAGGVGQTLEMFNGDIIFNRDGTGTFGQFSGEWTLADNDESLVIESSSLPVPSLATHIVELKPTSLKVTLTWGMPAMNIRMTFIPK